MKPSFGKTYEPQPVPPEVKSFLDAAKTGDLATVRTLLDQGVSVDVTAEDYPDMPWNKTPLMYAAKNGHLELVRTLLSAGASLTAVDKDATDSDDRHTPLHHAVAGGNLDIIDALLTAGADPNALTKFGRPPLNIAVYHNNFEAAKLLLERGASIRLKPGRKRYEPPLLAAIHGRIPMATTRQWFEFLLAAGADPNAFGRKKATALKSVAAGHDIDNDDRIAAIKMLLVAGAAADQPDDEGLTALFTAVLFNNARAAELLIEAGADLNREVPRGPLFKHADENMAFVNRDTPDATSHEKFVANWKIRHENAVAMIELLEKHGAKK
jgi:ankyrin repeat protein